MMLLNKFSRAFLVVVVYSFVIGSGCLSISKVTLRLLELDNNKYMNISISEYYDTGYSIEKWSGVEMQQESATPPLGVLIIENNSQTVLSIANVNSPKWRLVVQETYSDKIYFLQLVPVFNNTRYAKSLECPVASPLAVVVGARCITPKNFKLHSGFNTNAVVWVEYNDEEKIIRSNILQVHFFSNEIRSAENVRSHPIGDCSKGKHTLNPEEPKK